jgi:8-oxo-dGTP pyrophosphatase MutT (NUDIX family)
MIDLPPDLPARMAEQENSGIRWEGLAKTERDGRLNPAAVLLPLIKLKGQWHLVYTLRSVRLHEHSGQVSFPGGSWDPTDTSLTETALREAWEEIGLNPAAVRVLGCMAKVAMITRFMVTPVVGIVNWPTALTVNPDEVDRVFSIPLDWLADPTNQEFRVHTHGGIDFDVPYFKPYDGEIIWGATAGMTLDFLRLIK